MEFDMLFTRTATIAKQLEVRWFHSKSSSTVFNVETGDEEPLGIPHNVPFLRRTLLYIRLANGHGPTVSATLRIQGKKSDTTTSNPPPRPVNNNQRAVCTMQQPLKKLDLLFKCFKHRTHTVNDAFLMSPRRRTTRASTTTSSSTLPPLPSISRKHDRRGVAETTTKFTFSKALDTVSRKRSLDHLSSSLSGDDDAAPRPPRIPKPPRKAFDLYCMENRTKTRVALLDGVPRRENVRVSESADEYSHLSQQQENIQYKLKRQWDELDHEELTYWRHREQQDTQRYQQELQDYTAFKETSRNVKDSRPSQPGRTGTLSRSLNMSPLTDDTNILMSQMQVPPLLKAIESDTEGGAPISSSIMRAHTRMFVHYVHMDNGIPAVQVEMREDRRCPFCFHDAISDSGLYMHCVATHGPDLTFRTARSEDGTLHIAVHTNMSLSTPSMHAIDHLRDFVFIAPPPSRIVLKIPFVPRPIRLAATLDMPARKKKIRLLEVMGAEASALQRFIPTDDAPLRQYYHSRTNLPMLEGEWDEDSDDEPDDAWLHKISSELLDDFDDVSVQEKRFMKLWNEFIKSHTVISDRSLPDRCMLFVREKNQLLKKYNLRHELFLHLCNVWDFGLVSHSQLLACMTEYDSCEEVLQWPL